MIVQADTAVAGNIVDSSNVKTCTTMSITITINLRAINLNHFTKTIDNRATVNIFEVWTYSFVSQEVTVLCNRQILILHEVKQL